jgi:phage-related protein
MPGIGPGAHELRLKDSSGAYRVVYALILQGTVHVVHAFRKTTRTTPQRSRELAKRRLQEIYQRFTKEKKR